MSIFDVFRQKTYLDSLPPTKRKEIELLQKDLDRKIEDIRFLSDPNRMTQEINNIEQKLSNVLKGYPLINTSTSILGYEPAGSILRKLYPNPLSVYAFIGENYWAAIKARKEFRIDIERDGYVLIAGDRTAKKRLKIVNEALKDLKIPELRVNIADDLNVFGNAWIDRDTNLLGGLTGISKLLPEKILPVLNTYGDIVEGWEYVWGNKRIYFPLFALDHLKTYSLRSAYLGVPTLSGVVVDVEADLQASVFTNTLFQKGGLIKGIVSLDMPEAENIINEKVFDAFANRMQNMFSRVFAGVRGGGQLMFLPNVKGYHNILDPKNLEGPYKETSDRTAMKVAQLLGIPPVRLGLYGKSQYENKTQVDDAVALSFDNNIYYMMSIVDNYINEYILQRYLGIEDIEIKMAGEYNSVSLAAAEFLMKICASGTNLMTVDEFRQKVLRWEPIGGDEGAQWVGNIKNSLLIAQANQAMNASNPQDRAKALEKVMGPEHLTKKRKTNQIRYTPKDIDNL